MIHNVKIIAEAGVNHNGDIENAKKLVLAASKAGADFVKFQTFITELNISKSAKKAEYQNINTKDYNTSQYEMVKNLEISFQDFITIKEYCDDLNIGFLSTGFDSPSIDFLNTLNPKFFKIPSGEIINYPYLKKIALQNKPVVLSTGMADMSEIKEAVKLLIGFGLDKADITILHCNTEYPTPMEDVNLNAMITIKNELGVNVGYSDHTLGIEVPIAAVALGATIIEKHFTLDRNMPGPDHKASLEPEELKNMVNSIRNIEKAISGNGKKMPSKSEIKNKSIARKSIHVKTDLYKGEVLTEENLVTLRPGDGISPMEWTNVIGKKLIADVKAYQKLKREDFI